MTKTDLKSFRKNLQYKQAEIGKGITGREALVIETSPDELDRIQESGDREYAMSYLERISSRLHEVETAIRRIDKGAFGTCVDCGAAISRKRLDAVPWTSCCISCQEVADRRSKRVRNRIEPTFALAF